MSPRLRHDGLLVTTGSSVSCSGRACRLLPSCQAGAESTHAAFARFLILVFALETARRCSPAWESRMAAPIYAAALQRQPSRYSRSPTHGPAQGPADCTERCLLAPGSGTRPGRLPASDPAHVSANSRRGRPAAAERSGGFGERRGAHPSKLGMACRGRKLPEGREGDEPANDVAGLMQLCEEHTRGL